MTSVFSAKPACYRLSSRPYQTAQSRVQDYPYSYHVQLLLLLPTTVLLSINLILSMQRKLTKQGTTFMTYVSRSTQSNHQQHVPQSQLNTTLNVPFHHQYTNGVYYQNMYHPQLTSKWLQFTFHILVKNTLDYCVIIENIQPESYPQISIMLILKLVIEISQVLT